MPTEQLIRFAEKHGLPIEGDRAGGWRCTRGFIMAHEDGRLWYWVHSVLPGDGTPRKVGGQQASSHVFAPVTDEDAALKAIGFVPARTT